MRRRAHNHAGVAPHPRGSSGVLAVLALSGSLGLLAAGRRSLSARRRRRRHDATHDHLTGLLNRRALLEHLAAVPISGTRWLILLDLDDFKAVNEGAGHGVGDEVLCLVARRLRSALAADDIVARLGGDEFGIVCDLPTKVGPPTDLAERLLEAIRGPYALADELYHVGGSIGIAARTPGRPADLVLMDADTAMYAAKTAGRSRFEVHTEAMNESATRRRKLASELSQAIERSEFTLVFQPIVELEDVRVIGAEALVRWQHPTRGELLPGEFIAAAEKNGAIVPLGRTVLRLALERLQSWVSGGVVDPASFLLGVNVSTRQLEQAGFVEEVALELKRSCIDPANLVLEVTETSLLSSSEAVLSRLVGLRELGVSLAIDDFGTGYAGLGYLQRGLFDVVKLDRSLLPSGNTSREWAVAEAVLGLASAFEIGVVAEGIELSEQASMLRSLGCTKGQGFYFQRPVPAAEFVHTLERGRAAA